MAALPDPMSTYPSRRAAPQRAQTWDAWRMPRWDRSDPLHLSLRAVAAQVDWAEPLLALDVDGVIAPLADDRSSAWNDFRLVQANGFDMAFSRQMLDLLELSASSRVWLTSWEDDANRSLVPHLGWEPLPTISSSWRYRHFPYHHRIPTPSATSGRRWWKLSSLCRLLRFVSDDPYDDGLMLPPALVWLDDDLDRNPAAGSWVRRLPFPALLIAPEPNQGLSRFQVDQVSAFTATHSPSRR